MTDIDEAANLDSTLMEKNRPASPRELGSGVAVVLMRTSA